MAEEIGTQDWGSVSAMTNTQLKVRRRPRLRVTEQVLKVCIGVLLTVSSVKLMWGLPRSVGEDGITLT